MSIKISMISFSNSEYDYNSIGKQVVDKIKEDAMKDYESLKEKVHKVEMVKEAVENKLKDLSTVKKYFDEEIKKQQRFRKILHQKFS